MSTESFRDQIRGLLKDENQQHVNKFASYCQFILTDVDKKKGGLKNPWMQSQTADMLAERFRYVQQLGLVFDGVHVTLQSTGISFDYIAYKNLMLIAYPETKMDLSLVHEGDEFTVGKDSGSVSYAHKINDPFKQTDKNVVGGYCIIRNKRGEFLTLLSSEDFAKHRRKAKTDFIWGDWFREMCLKTLIKKAVKYHFADVFGEMDQIDNETNCDLDNPVNLDLEWKAEIDAIDDPDQLAEYYFKNQGRGADFDRYVKKRSDELKAK